MNTNNMKGIGRKQTAFGLNDAFHYNNTSLNVIWIAMVKSLETKWDNCKRDFHENKFFATCDAINTLDEYGTTYDEVIYLEDKQFICHFFRFLYMNTNNMKGIGRKQTAFGLNDALHYNNTILNVIWITMLKSLETKWDNCKRDFHENEIFAACDAINTLDECGTTYDEVITSSLELY